MKDGISQVIINVEAQKDEPSGYHILNRAVFYVSRLVSSQKERDFAKTNYNDIRRVFSIWVCMGMDELPEHDEKYELHRLLSTLLSMELTVDEKLGIIEKEYSIVVDDRIREDVSAMCNLSQGIREKGRADGEEKFILNMHKKGYTLEQIAECAEKTIEEVEAVIKKREPVLA